MAEIIEKIIDDRIIDDFIKLNDRLDETLERMTELVGKAGDLNKALTGSSLKEVAQGMKDLETVTKDLTKTENDRLGIEKQIKAEGQKMADAVKVQAKAMDELSKKTEWKNKNDITFMQTLDDQKAKLKDLTASYKKLSAEWGNTPEMQSVLKEKAAEMTETKIKIMELTVQQTEYNKEAKKMVEINQAAEGSIKQMSAQLVVMKDQYRALSEEQRDTEFGKQLQDSINELDNKLKGLDKSIGDNQRNVGNYEIASKSLRTTFRELREEIWGLTTLHRELEGRLTNQRALVDQLAQSKGFESEEYKTAVKELQEMGEAYNNAGREIETMTKKAADISDLMGDVNRSINVLADDANKSAAVAEGLGVIGDSYQVIAAGMQVMGVSSEELGKTFMKLQLLQQGINAVTRITNSLQKESILRLKLKSTWKKIVLAFTKQQAVSSKIETEVLKENAATTTGAAAATGTLAASQTVATKTTFSLTAALRSVGLAIKSIPVIGWILGAVAALGTLTILIYKHVTAEKELTEEQVKQKRLSKELAEIRGKVVESTMLTVLKVKELTKELKKTVQGSAEWEKIVGEVNKLTGLTLDATKTTKEEIKKLTDEWVTHYRKRARAEVVFQKVAESEIELMQLEREFKAADSKTRREKGEELGRAFGLTKKETEELIKQQNIVKGTIEHTEKNNKSWEEVNRLIDIARSRNDQNNQSLLKTIDVMDLIENKQETIAKVETDKDTIEDLTAKYEAAAISIKKYWGEINRDLLTQTEARFDKEILDIKEKQKKEREEVKGNKDLLLAIEKKHADELRRLQENKGAEVERIRRMQAAADQIMGVMNEDVDNELYLLQTLGDAYDEIAEKIEAVGVAKEKAFDLELYRKRVGAVNELTSGFIDLGLAISENAKNERDRIKMQQRLIMLEVLMNKALAISMIIKDEGDPYTKAFRIAANLAAVLAAMTQATSAINQANSISAYAEGTDYHKGGLAIVGEGKNQKGAYVPELVESRGKSYIIDRPTLLDLDRGAKVTPLEEEDLATMYLKQIASRTGSEVRVDVSGRILPQLRKDMQTITFINKQFRIRA